MGRGARGGGGLGEGAGAGVRRRQLMFGNASQLFRAQRLPLLRPRRSLLPAFVEQYQRGLTAQQQVILDQPSISDQQRVMSDQQARGRQQEQDSSSCDSQHQTIAPALQEKHQPLSQQQQQQQREPPRAVSGSDAGSFPFLSNPTVAELAEVSLAGQQMPPMAILLKRAAQLENELLHGRLHYIMEGQQAAADLAGEPEVAIPRPRRAPRRELQQRGRRDGGLGRRGLRQGEGGGEGEREVGVGDWRGG